MSNLGESKFIGVSSDSFICKPANDQEVLQNQLIVKFCLDAMKHGYRVMIFYDDYDPKNIYQGKEDAYDKAIKSTSKAVDNYNNMGVFDTIDPDKIIERLFPYSAYQILDKAKIQKETTEFAFTQIDADPLDHLAIMVSPQNEKVLQMCFNDIDLYLPVAEIDGFDGFDAVMKHYYEDVELHATYKREKAASAESQLNMISDLTTIRNRLGKDSDRFILSMKSDPIIRDFIHTGAAYRENTTGQAKITDNEYWLTRYFATLIRANECASKKQIFERAATAIQNKLSKVKGGTKATLRVENYFKRIPTQGPPSQKP